MPAGVDGLGDALEGRDVDAAAASALGGLVAEEAQDGELGAERLAGGGRRADQHVLVRVVQNVEGLRGRTQSCHDRGNMKSNL